MKTKMKLVRLELTPESHARLRVIAGAAGVPMSQFVRSLVEERIRQDKKIKTR